MKFQRHLKEEVSVNLTPLIDVVFLLLIFFMVTTTFSRDTRLLIDLPEAQGEAAPAPSGQIEIQVGRDGGYAVNGRVLAGSGPAPLRRALEASAGGDTGLPLVIRADAAATHQAVVTAMDTAAGLGFTRLTIATRQAEVEQ